MTTELEDDIGTEIASELVKSYGFRRGDDGSFSWSVENVGKAFEENPFWTSLDYITLAMPPARWALGAVRVARGSGFAGKAYAKGRVGFKEAMRLSRAGPSNSRVGRYFETPGSVQIDDASMPLFDEFAGATERRGLSNVLRRELSIERSAFERMRNDAMRTVDRASNPEAIDQLLHLRPDDDGFKALWNTLDSSDHRAFQASSALRNHLHDASYEVGLISEETWARQYARYAPRHYRETIEPGITEGTRAAIRGGRPSAKAGEANYMRRSLTEAESWDHPEMTRFLDPQMSLAKMAQSGFTVAAQRYAKRVGDSPFAKTSDEMIAAFGTVEDAEKAGWRRLEDLFPGREGRASARTSRLKAQRKRLETELNRWNRETRAASTQSAPRLRKQQRRIGRRLAKLDDQIAESVARDAQRGMMRHIPPGLRQKWVDPLARDAFEGATKMNELNIFQKLYDGAMGAFKAGHTAYNPATHARNFLGNTVFYSMAMGLGRTATLLAQGGPTRGIKSWLKQDETYRDALKVGIIGSGFDSEISAHMRRVYGREATGMDWLAEMLEGKSMHAFGEKVRRGAGKLERLYGAEDEVWKLEAFGRLRNRYMRKAGMTKDQATAQAALDVFRYFPNYQDTNPLTDMMRGHLPFVSFPMEAARVWKNGMLSRPWVPFFWNHMTESATTIFGHTSGFTQDEIDAARQSLPWYTEEKKMALLPMRTAEGKPQFLDLSYIIPMADMGADAQMAESTFMGVPIPQPISPETNPLFQIVAGAVTGVDPFSERPIEPRFTEMQAGIAVPEGMPRRAVGMVEHLLRTMLPPLMPPGYVGVNLMELARGTKSGATGEPLEKGVTRTLMTNLAGLRTYEPTVGAQITNVRRERRLEGQELTHVWDRWEAATANGDLEQAERARARIIELKGAEYFMDRMSSHMPGSYKNMSRKDVMEVLRRAQRFEATPEEVGPLYARLVGG